MGTPETWFRQQYNLAPTDERFLHATPSEIRIDFYLHYLERRLQLAKEKRIEVKTLDDVLGPLTFEEKQAATERALAQKAEHQEPDRITFSKVNASHA